MLNTNISFTGVRAMIGGVGSLSKEKESFDAIRPDIEAKGVTIKEGQIYRGSGTDYFFYALGEEPGPMRSHLDNIVQKALKAVGIDRVYFCDDPEPEKKPDIEAAKNILKSNTFGYRG